MVGSSGGPLSGQPFHTAPARCGRRLVLYVPPSVRKSSVPEVTRERKSPPDPLGCCACVLVLGHWGAFLDDAGWLAELHVPDPAM